MSDIKLFQIGSRSVGVIIETNWELIRLYEFRDKKVIERVWEE